MVVRRYVGEGGTIKATLSANQEWLDLMRPRERNAMLSSGGRRAGNAWRWKYMPRRFSKEVLGPPFNYQGDKRSPLRDSGEMFKAVFTGKIKATAPGGRLKIRIPLPFGHPVTKEISRVMKVVPPDEVNFVAEWLGDWIAGERGQLSQATRGRLVNGRRRLQLSSNQRRRFGVRSNRRRRR